MYVCTVMAQRMLCVQVRPVLSLLYHDNDGLRMFGVRTRRSCNERGVHEMSPRLSTAHLVWLFVPTIGGEGNCLPVVYLSKLRVARSGMRSLCRAIA